jgi:hypothetical protein
LEDRTTLVIPADMVGSLDVPPLALDTGGGDPEWVEWPLRGGRVLRLPVSPKLARKLGWRIRARRYVTAGLLIAAAGYLAVALFLSTSVAGRLWAQFALLCATITLTQVSAGLTLKQAPRRLRGGRLQLREVPVTVAQRWADVNPGVLVKVRRPYGTSFPPGVLPFDRS